MTNIVHNCDCNDFMKDIPDNYYDLALVDPPYGINAGEGTEIYINSNKQNWKGKKINKNIILGKWDNCIPNEKYFNNLFRINKKYIIWGGNYFLTYFNKETGIIVWDKLNGKSFFSDGEIAIHNFNNKLRIFKYLSCGFMGSHKNKEIRIHPTQKPIALYKWLLQNYAKPGYKIFDSHVGSGSSRIACYELGFDFEGCELDKDYWRAQEKRFMEFKKKFHNEFYIPEKENLLFK